jgi:hypothetical protein
VSAAVGNNDDAQTVPYIAHEEFVRGVPYGHFRVIVNPTLARPYVVQRMRINGLAITSILIGAVLALSVSGQALPGAALVALGIGANRLVRHQAGKIVLHLAVKDPAVYAEVTSNGVMEVRRAVG